MSEMFEGNSNLNERIVMGRLRVLRWPRPVTWADVAQSRRRYSNFNMRHLEVTCAFVKKDIARKAKKWWDDFYKNNGGGGKP